MAKLSIVIPVFNAVAYLPALVQSLSEQTFRDFEVIFVNDGSTDASAELIQTLGATLPAMRLISQPNQGQAVARNTGMDQVDSEFIAFVDADDILHPDMYGTLMPLAEDNRLEIALANAWNFFPDQPPHSLVYSDVGDSGVITGEEWLQRMVQAKKFYHYCWMGVYRTDFVRRHAGHFPIADPHEDVIWITEALLACQRFQFIATPLYYYRNRINKDSIMTPARQDKIIRAALYNSRGLYAIGHRQVLAPLTRKLLIKDAYNSGFKAVRLIAQIRDRQRLDQHLTAIRDSKLWRQMWASSSRFSHYLRTLRYLIKVNALRLGLLMQKDK